MESCLSAKRQKLFRNDLGPLHLYNCLWQTTCCHQFPLLHTCAHQDPWLLQKASARTCACWPAVESVWKALDCGAISAISSIASTEISTNHRSSGFHDRKSLLKFSELSCLTFLEPNSFISLSVHIISIVHCFGVMINKRPLPLRWKSSGVFFCIGCGPKSKLISASADEMIWVNISLTWLWYLSGLKVAVDVKLVHIKTVDDQMNKDF